MFIVHVCLQSLPSALSCCLLCQVATFEHIQIFAMNTTDKKLFGIHLFILKLCVIYTICMELERFVSVFVPFISGDVG